MQALGDSKDLEIRISGNKEARTLTIRDTGVSSKDLPACLVTQGSRGVINPCCLLGCRWA